MTHWICLLGLLVSASAQEPKPEDLREVRVYLIDRRTPERVYKDAAAVLTLERPFGRSQTFLLPLVSKPAPAPAGAAGMIRGLPGTPYFVELNLDPHAAPGAPEKRETERVEGKTPPGPLPGREVLRRVHQGATFAQKIPRSALSDPFTATVTIRLGSTTFTSEEFQKSQGSGDDPEAVAARIERSLETLQARAREQAGFMDLRPIVVDLIRELSRLAPAGFEDGSGRIELDRQWCLAHARAIERASYDGDTSQVLDLSLKCGPRLREMQSILAGTKKEPDPELPKQPEVPTVK